MGWLLWALGFVMLLTNDVPNKWLAVCVIGLGAAYNLGDKFTDIYERTVETKKERNEVGREIVDAISLLFDNESEDEDENL